MENNTWDQPQRDIGSDGIITSLVKGKLREGWIVCKMHDHFLSESHNGLVNDVKIVFIDKTDSSDLTRREEFCSIKLKTLAPYGLNVEE